MTEPDGQDYNCVICRKHPPRKPLVCDRCRQRESARLSEIVHLYAVLPAALPVNPNTVIDLTYPPVGGASALVVVHEFDPRWQDQTGDINVAARLDSWVRDWLEQRIGTDPPKVPTVMRLAMWLQIWLPVACDEHPAVDEYAGEIRRLAATMRRAINRDLSPVRYEAPCPYCAVKTLRREPGGDWIECGDCGRLWGEDEYGLLARAAIGDDELLSTEEAAVVAKVEVGTIRVWAHRGKLNAEYPEGQTRPWYRKGEVQAVAERMAA